MHMEAGKNARLAWSFAEDFRSRDIHEVAERAPNGIIRNGAERAVTGRNWNGAEDSFVAAAAAVPEPSISTRTTCLNSEWGI